MLSNLNLHSVAFLALTLALSSCSEEANQSTVSLQLGLIDFPTSRETPPPSYTPPQNSEIITEAVVEALDELRLQSIPAPLTGGGEFGDGGSQSFSFQLPQGRSLRVILPYWKEARMEGICFRIEPATATEEPIGDPFASAHEQKQDASTNGYAVLTWDNDSLRNAILKLIQSPRPPQIAPRTTCEMPSDWLHHSQLHYRTSYISLNIECSP